MLTDVAPQGGGVYNLSRMTTRRKGILWATGFGIPLVLGMLYVAYWFIGAYQVTQAIATWQSQQRAAGVHFDHGGIHVGGFPSYRIAIGSPQVEWRTSKLSWLWASHSISARAGPWSFDTVHGEITGGHKLVVQDSTMTTTYAVATEQARFVLHTGNSRGRANIRLQQARITSQQLLKPFFLAAGDFTVSAALGHGAISDLALEVEANGLGPLPGAWYPVNAIDQVSLRTIWAGSVPPDVSYDALADWRDRGGTIELPRVFVKIGETSFSGNGTLALDQEMRPLAAFSAHLRGFESALDMLSTAQELSAIEGAALRIALRLMAKRSSRPGSIEFPLTVQDGRVYAGRIPIARLGPLLSKPQR